MKRHLLSLLFISIAIPALAQIKNGQFLVGGNISFESLKVDRSTDDYKTMNLFISPNIGYFIIDKLAGGLRFDLRSYKQTTPIDSRHISTSISPFIRYYFLPSVKKVNAFIDVGYLNYRTRHSYGSSSPYTQKSNGYHISAGPVIFLSDKVALEFILGYKRNLLNHSSEIESRFNTALGLQIHLGKIKRKEKKD